MKLTSKASDRSKAESMLSALIALAVMVAFSLPPQLGVAESISLPASDPTQLIDRARLDPARVQGRLGKESDKIFAYVRDRIHMDGYVGVLRGAQGTLLAGSGNAVDQAILLSELLTRAGFETRIAQGTLNRSSAETLWKTILQLEAHPHSAADESESDERRICDALEANIAKQYGLIGETLKAGGFSKPTKPAITKEKILEQLRDHYWVQCKVDDNWINLDPSFPSAKVNQAFAEAEQTLPSLPNSLFHQAMVRVVVEEQHDGRTKKQILLEHKARACDLAATQVFLTHESGSWEKPVPLLALTRAVGDAFGALSRPAIENNAKPVLVVGDDYIVGKTFNIVHPSKERNAKSDSKKPKPRSRGGFGGLGGLADMIRNDGAEPTDATTGEWMEFEFHAPDGRIARTRRMIFDRLGIAAREEGGNSSKPSREPLGMKHPLNSLFCLSFYTGNVSFDFISQPPEESSTTPSTAQTEFFDCGRILIDFNDSVAMLSDRAIDFRRMDGRPVFFSYASPRLIISEIRSSVDAETVAIDLRRMPHCFYAPPELLTHSFAIQALCGVVDGVVESQILELLTGPKPDSSRPAGEHREVYSAVNVFKKAGQQGVPFRLLKDSDASAYQDLTANTLARITDDVSRGNLLVIPHKAVSIDGKNRTAWWRINRATGASVAVTDQGLHAAAQEYQNLMVIIRQPLQGPGYALRFYQPATGQWVGSGWNVANHNALRQILRTLGQQAIRRRWVNWGALPPF